MTSKNNPVIIPRNWFECWRDPKDFFCTAWEQIKPLTGSAPPQHIRDAYVAGLFARIWDYHSSCEVRLTDKRDEFPDAHLREGKHTIDLEIVTADKYARQTWKEQKEILEKYKHGEFVPIDCPEKRRDDALEAIARVVKHKATRHYSAPSTLLVYLMIAQTPTVSYPLISVNEMALLTEPYKANFESIWVLCGLEDVRLWPDRKILGVPPCQDPFDCSRCAE
ncbi:MAG TPA: hypothetical protein VJX94_06195 [Stellaceae bacterium]|nr:hypothetical protein [Stellaceae bacterium]